MIETVWAILQKDNKFLLAQRSWDNNHGGTWVFPGGKIDRTDRNPQEAIYRELREEAGLTGKRFRKLGDIHLGKYHIQSFVCDQWVGKPKPSSSDIIDIGWFSLGEMYSMGSKLAPFVCDGLMSIAYLIQNYDHFPNQWVETWKEVGGNG